MPGPSPLRDDGVLWNGGQPENDRWTDASFSRLFFDRLNCSKDMKLLKGAGHFPIEKEGLVHLEQYCVEFLEECLARHCVSGFQLRALYCRNGWGCMGVVPVGLPCGKSYEKMV